MSIEDHASLVSIRAQITHLEDALRRLPAPQLVPSAERESAIAAMVELAREMHEFGREARRLARQRREHDQSLA
jgi:hypothetical protein